LFDRFIIPNFHVVLVHFPLAFLLIGTAIELLACLWPKSSVRPAARWMILIGALAMLPTAASGMNAFAESEFTSDEQRHMLVDHVWKSSVAAVIAAIAATFGLACSDKWRRKLHWPILVVIALCCLLIVSGAWNAGEAVYRHRTNVLVEPEVTTQPAVTAEAGSRGLAYFVPPMDGHLLSAGLSTAFAFAAIGVAFRRVTRTAELDHEHAEAARQPRKAPVTALEAPMEEPTKPRYYWLIAVLLAIVTSLLGWWYLADSSDTWGTAMERVGPRPGVVDKVHRFLRELVLSVFEIDRKTRSFEFPRRAFHVINAGVMVGLMIALSLIGRFGKRKWRLLAILSFLLLLSIAAQTWIGTLMLYEGPSGKITGWSVK